MKEWVNQREVLAHRGVDGLLYESLRVELELDDGECVCVPILDLPLMAEQHLKTMMVVDHGRELGIGI